MDAVIEIINRIQKARGRPRLATWSDGLRLRDDLGFDSMDLAELTVRIEDRLSVDVFAEGLVHTLGELRARLE